MTSPSRARAPLGLLLLTFMLAMSALGAQRGPQRAALAMSDPMVMAAGDIACGQATPGSTRCGHLATSRLILDADPDAVLALGDIQYECGDLQDFSNFFDPTWGRFRDRIYPVVGNHEYRVDDNQDGDDGGATDGDDDEGRDDPDDGPLVRCSPDNDGAVGYWSYFGDVSTPLEPGCRLSCGGYYSFDIGEWHLVALNSNCNKVSCLAGSPQEAWLREDLAAHPTACTLAFFHHPRYSSGRVGSAESMQPIWETLNAYGVDVVLSGHDHDYERFAPMNAAGELDESYGLRQYVVGTGGRSHTQWQDDARLPNSDVSDDATYGVLSLVLHETSYEWEFVPVENGDGEAVFTDDGTAQCHGAPPS